MGRASRCKMCRRRFRNHERDAQYGKEYRKANEDKIRRTKKIWYKLNAERILKDKREHYIKNKAEYARRDKIYYEANREKARRASKRYREENRGKEVLRNKKYRTLNPHKQREHNRLRHARKLSAPGNFTEQDWRNILRRYAPDGHCPCCGEVKELHRDHVIPMSKGGSNSAENIQPLCISCNSSKWTKSTDYRPDRGAWTRQQLVMALDNNRPE